MPAPIVVVPDVYRHDSLDAVNEERRSEAPFLDRLARVLQGRLTVKLAGTWHGFFGDI